jgi:monofunctional biosynthetic peptidoglycan transglycosylase
MMLPRAAGGGAGGVAVPGVVAPAIIEHTSAAVFPAEASLSVGSALAEAQLPQVERAAELPLAWHPPAPDAPTIPNLHAVLTVVAHDPEPTPAVVEPRAEPPFLRSPAEPSESVVSYVREMPAVELHEPAPAPGVLEPRPEPLEAEGLVPAPPPLPRPAARAPVEPSAPTLRRPAVTPAWTVRRVLWLTTRIAAAAVLALTVLLVSLTVLYRWVDPPASTLMLGQRLIGMPIRQQWVALDRISPNLQRAAILSEDGRFCRHGGVDWGELKEAIEQTRDGIPRGGSTISMQVVKNLFLWPSKSYLRKAVEIPLAYLIEAAWSKRRILEIYLNIAEWGPGVFGAEAASRYHFHKPALLLTGREAALLAVSLPNPFDREAGNPGLGTQRLANNLLVRLRAGQGNVGCLSTGGPVPRVLSGQGR